MYIHLHVHAKLILGKYRKKGQLVEKKTFVTNISSFWKNSIFKTTHP